MISAEPKYMSGTDQVPDDSLDRLAEFCIAARSIIDTRNAPMMRSLVDMLLLEIGVELATGRSSSDGMKDNYKSD